MDFKAYVRNCSAPGEEGEESEDLVASGMPATWVRSCQISYRLSANAGGIWLRALSVVAHSSHLACGDRTPPGGDWTRFGGVLKGRYWRRERATKSIFDMIIEDSFDVLTLMRNDYLAG